MTDDADRCDHPTPHGEADTCPRRGTYDDGLCWQHTDLADHDIGRTSLLEQRRGRAIEAELCELLSRGHSVAVAATKAGVDPSTYRTWRRRGRAALDAGEQGPFAEFYSKTERARMEGAERFEAILLDETLPEDASGRFSKAMEILGRRWPEVWAAPGHPNRRDVGGDLTVELGGDDPDDIEYATTPAGLGE